MDLCASVPSVPKSKLASGPYIIDEDSLDKLFESIDRRDMAGNRDTAILKMLSTSGLRGRQVSRLKLEDLFRGQGRILFSAGQRRTK